MENNKTTGSLTSFITLNDEEERILEMYSRGESYEVIQENLFMEYGLDYSQKKLGYKMGVIKKKMKCETQFQMGYLYGRRETNFQIADLRTAFNEKLREARENSLKQMPQVISEKLQDYSLAKERHKGLNIGLVSASIFWLTLFGIVSNYIF